VFTKNYKENMPNSTELSLLLGTIASYLKTTPSILALAINTLITIACVVLGRLKQWLRTPKNTFVFSLLASLILTSLTFILYTIIGALPSSKLVSIVYFIILFILSSIAVFVSIFLTADKTAMGKHENQIEQDIKDPGFNDRVIRVTEALSMNLRDIDIQTNWSVLNFVSLDAEVELIREGKSREKKVTDLLQAIKSSGSERLFLVIGDPGSGKSVALRKLCQDLAKEVGKTGKIPVYINLKEWQDKWDRDNPPSVIQLNNFILSNLSKRDIVTAGFFEKYYSVLYEQGRLYFVLDSFDEIPSVLGEQENSILIKQLSAVMHDFLLGARKNSQGIVSSRVFRRPTDEFKTRTILEIRPFSESKINLNFYKTLGYNKDFVKQLFKHRFDLLSAASNPFTASLLASYAKDNQDNLPNNLLELYESYFNTALNSSAEVIKSNGITKSIVEEVSLNVADIMFKNYGFEVKLSTLKESLPATQRLYVEQVIDVLQFARIGRRSRETGLFSFSHRRFCEFFVVKRMVASEQDLHLSDIPNDSQWRDALVMYCQVATVEQAFLIADYCWKIIRDNENPLDLRYIHCLRFLRDAFKARVEIIKPFRDELSSHILVNIKDGKNVISSKISVECLGLLDEEHVDSGASSAMSTNNIWLIETAIKACRTLPNVSLELQKGIKSYIRNLDLLSYLGKNTDLLFSLSLSPSMNKAKYLHTRLVIDIWLLLFALFLPSFIAVITSDYQLIIATILSAMLAFALLSFPLITSLPSLGMREMLWLVNISTLVALAVESRHNHILYTTLILLFFLYICHILLVFGLDPLNLLKSIINAGIINFLLGFSIITILLGAITGVGFLLRYIVVKYGLQGTIFTFCLAASILFASYIASIFYKNIRIRSTVAYHRCNDREYINEVINMFPNARARNKALIMRSEKGIFTSFTKEMHNAVCSPIETYFLNDFVSYLESNVQNVKGSWSDDSIFEAKNQRLPLVRLSRLEEKWRGMNR
jgi:hypothetical protein